MPVPAFHTMQRARDESTAQREPTLRFDHADSTNPTEFDAWQKSLRGYLRRVVYKLESDAGRPTETNDEGAFEGVRRREVLLRSSDGSRIPAVLLLPQTPNGASLIVLPGHVKDGESGLRQLTEDIPSYHNSAALRFARAGYVTLAIELRGFGLLGLHAYPDHRNVAYNALLSGRFYKQLIVEDVAAAVDYLVYELGIDEGRLGMAGVSLGGEVAIAYSGLDTRIQAISSHAYGGGRGLFPLLGPAHPQPHYCHIVPSARTLYRREAPFLLIAPRPLQALRGTMNAFDLERFRKALEPHWVLAGDLSTLQIANIDAQAEYRGHAFFVAEAIEFFDATL
ncbi:MAG: acetylxylan esterase [Pseudomonadota bacterium]